MEKPKAQTVPITSLKNYKGNARVGDIDVIRESIRKNGVYKPVVVRTQTREILAGNHTWEAAKLEGETEIDAYFIDCDAATAKRINLIDNRAPELGGYNEEALLAQLGSMPDLEGTGWGSRDRDRLSASLVRKIGGDTEPKEIPQKPKARRGDLYLLGEHKLLCGDCTNQADVGRLFGGQEAAVAMWTDPPYIGPDDNSSQGVNAARSETSHSIDGLRQLLIGCFGVADQFLEKGSPLYVAHPGGANSVLFGECFIAQPGWRVKQTLVWLKENPNYGYGHDYHTQHEIMFEGEKDDPELVAYGFTRSKAQKARWYGNRRQASALVFDRPKHRLHPTAKPVGLVEQLLINSTPKGGLVYEPFAGSGTAIIAAHNIGRRCNAVEIDPGYVDVIVDRFLRHTGVEATLLKRDT